MFYLKDGEKISSKVYFSTSYEILNKWKEKLQEFLKGKERKKTIKWNKSKVRTIKWNKIR